VLRTSWGVDLIGRERPDPLLADPDCAVRGTGEPLLRVARTRTPPALPVDRGAYPLFQGRTTRMFRG